MKPRVWHVAKELGITSKELIKYLNDIGVYVRTPSSTFEASDLARARKHFAPGNVERTRPAPVTRPRPRRHVPPPQVKEDVPSPVEAVAGYSHLHNPFFSPADYPVYLQALILLGAVKPPPPLRVAPLPIRGGREPITETDRLFLPPRGVRITADDVAQAKSFTQSWALHAFSDSEIGTWLAAGLKAHEAWLAAEIQEEGITPDRLHEACQNRKTKQPWTIVEVARRLPQERAYNPDATMGALLDEWLVPRSPRRRGRTG